MQFSSAEIDLLGQNASVIANDFGNVETFWRRLAEAF